MAANSGNSQSLTLDLEGLNLEDLCLPPEITRSLGTIPKVKPINPSVAPTREEVKKQLMEAANSIPALVEGEGSVHEAETPLPSPMPGKRRRNRRQRKKRSSAKDGSDPDAEGDKSSGKAAADPLDRIPEIPAFPAMEALRDEHLQQKKTLEAASRIAGGEQALEAGPAGAAAVTGSVPEPGKKAGSRRRRGGKRKKPVSPESRKTSDKENELKIDLGALGPKSDDEDDDEDDHESSAGGDSDRKFLWRNVTKNGWIKKCILVDGVIEGGRPKLGDTVLVKSQGKLKDGTIIDDFPTQVFNVGEHEVIEGLDFAVQSMYKNELSILSVKPEMAYGSLGRKSDIPPDTRITYLFGLLHFEKQKEICQLTWAQRRKSGQSRMRLANWWYQRKEYPIAVKCYKKALEYYNNIPTNQECSTPEEYKELLQLMEERLRVMRQVANIFKRIANLIQSGAISS